jgi:hypothetical protein
MRITALLFALFAIVVGIAGLAAPDGLIALGRYVGTPVGLYAVAALRVTIGIVLVRVAPVSRVPRTLRVVGACVIVAGLALPFFGVERTRAILDWEATQGTAVIRGAAGLLVAIGGFIAFAVAPRRVPKP